jgi:hypothetical protein
MITDDKCLSPFGQQIAEDIAMSDISDRFNELVSNYKDCSDLIYKKYHLMDLEIKKEETDTEKIILTQGDLDLYFLIKRFALGMMGANLHHLHEMCLKYSSFCDRVATYTRLEQPKDKSKEE